jgi:hypothetical protein
MLNANSAPIEFRLTNYVGIARWTVEIDTCFVNGKRPDRRTFVTGESYPLQGRSSVLLRIMKAPL